MKKESNSGISFFQRYLTVWVIVCMLIGIMLGHFLPGMKEALNHLEYAGISIPMAVLIWIMIYPMMMKVDFKSIKNIGKNPKGLFVTWIVNWLIKPFTMYGIASFFFFVVFKTWITPDLATEYLAGAVLLGAAPCTAMVFVWSTLTKGNICVHNSCRSQIAEALGKHLASDVFESYSAGTETKLQINQDAVRIMKELYGIDMEAEGQYSKLIDEIPVPDIAISMGCNVGCPFIERPFDDNWGLEDPTGKSDEEFKKVIDKIRMQIFILKQQLDEFEEN